MTVSPTARPGHVQADGDVLRADGHWLQLSLDEEQPWSAALGFGGGAVVTPRSPDDDDATWGGASTVSFASTAK